MDILALKNCLRKGEVVIGTWVFEFNSPGIARLLATTGVDFVAYDMEHSGLGTESIRSLVAQSRSANLAAMVRPPAAQYHLIAPLLDLGAGGIIAPMVETSSDAARVADSCRYFPEGHRGAAFSVAHDDFLPGDVVSKIRTANETVVCSVLIETDRAVKNLEEILAIPGIDLIWVGHFDLSLSLGIPGQFEDRRFIESMNKILKGCESHCIPVGIMVTDVKQAIERVRQGFRCLTYWGDLWLLQRALCEGVQSIRHAISAGLIHGTRSARHRIRTQKRK